ncbi:MAG: hypothetical protein Q9163_001102 [Psora crenata]
MDESHDFDPMDWSPQTSPNVLYSSSKPFKRSPVRKFDDFADGTEPTQRPEPSPLQTHLRPAVPSVAQSSGRLPMQWLGSCVKHVIAVAVAGAKCRLISIFTASTLHQQRQSSRRSPPRSRIFRQNPITITGHASTTPITRSNWRSRNDTLSTEERDYCVQDQHQHPNRCYPFQPAITSAHGAMMSGALQPQYSGNSSVTPEPAYLDSPRSLRVRQMPGTYPDLPSPIAFTTEALPMATENVSTAPARPIEGGLPLMEPNVSPLPKVLPANRDITAVKSPHDEVDAYDEDNAGSQTSNESQEVVSESSSVASSDIAVNVQLYPTTEEHLEDEAEETCEEKKAMSVACIDRRTTGPDDLQLTSLNELASIHATMVDTLINRRPIDAVPDLLPSGKAVTQLREEVVHPDAIALAPSYVDEGLSNSCSPDSIAPAVGKIDLGLNASSLNPMAYDHGLQNSSDDLLVANASPVCPDIALLKDDGLIGSTQSPNLAELSLMTEDIAVELPTRKRRPLSGLSPNQFTMTRLDVQSTPKSSVAMGKRSNLIHSQSHLSAPKGVSKYTRLLSLLWFKRHNHHKRQSLDNLPMAMQTPARVKKSVAFAESPKTGRPVTRTKRYYIGEAIDHPSPSSSRDESTLMSTPSVLKSEEEASEILTSAENFPRTPITEDQAVGAQLFNELFPTVNECGYRPSSPIINNHHGSYEHLPSGQQQHTSPGPGAASSSLPVSITDQQESSYESSNDSSEHFLQSISDHRSSLEHANQEPNRHSMNLEKDGEDDVFVESGQGTSPSHIPLPPTCTSFPDLSVAVSKIELSEELHTSERRRSARQQLKAEEEAKLIARLAEEHAAYQARLKKEAEAAATKAGVRRMPKMKIIEPLSPEADEMVIEALKKGEHAQVALASSGNPITRRDIGKVLPQRGTNDDQSGWLNDEIISAYLQMVVDHGHEARGKKRNETPKLHAFNAFFYTNLQAKGYEGVKRWAKRAKIGGKDLEKVEYVFMPVNRSGNHWTLAVISPMHKTIEYFDSLHGPSGSVYSTIKTWLRGELGSAYKEEEWKIREEPGFHGRGGGPSQDNAKDCGVFAATTAKMIALGVDPMAVSAEDMPTQRRRMVAEILNGGFSGALAPNLVF